MKRIAMRSLLAALVFSLFPASLRAAAGALGQPVGPVFIQRSGAHEWTTAQAPSEFNPGDSVKTGPGGAVEIVFNDGTTSRISENSIFELEEASPKRMSFFMRLGALEAFVTHVAGRSFQVRTPTSVAAVRGTELRVEVASSGETTWNLFAGTLAIFDARGSQVVLQANQQVQIDNRGQAGAPRPIPPEILRPLPPTVKPKGQTLAPSAPTGKKEAALAAAKTGLKVTAVTGEIEVTVDGKTTIYKGDALPVDFEIPSGARVRVLSGTAVLAGSQVALQVGEGADFNYAVTASADKMEAKVTVNAGSSDIQIEVQDHIAVLKPGDQAQAIETAKGTALKADRGTIVVVNPSGETKTISPGESTQPASPPPATSPQGTPPPPPPPPPPTTTNQDHQVVSPSSP